MIFGRDFESISGSREEVGEGEGVVGDSFHIPHGGALVLTFFFEFYPRICFNIGLPVNGGSFLGGFFDSYVGDDWKRDGGERIVVGIESLTIFIFSFDSKMVGGVFF